jgi:hypothetical protein
MENNVDETYNKNKKNKNYKEGAISKPTSPQGSKSQTTWRKLI